MNEEPAHSQLLVVTVQETYPGGRLQNRPPVSAAPVVMTLCGTGGNDLYAAGSDVG